MNSRLHLSLHIPTPNNNPLLRIFNSKLPVGSRPHPVLIRLLAFLMLERTIHVQAWMIATRHRNLMVINAVGPSTMHAEFAGDRKSFLDGNRGVFIGTVGVVAVGEEFTHFGFFASHALDCRAWVAQLALHNER